MTDDSPGLGRDGQPRLLRNFDNLSNTVATVTIDTPRGAITKYYLLCRDNCYSFKSILVGASGGIGIGIYSKVLFEPWTKRKPLLPLPPYVTWIYRQVSHFSEKKLSLTLKKHKINLPVFLWNTIWWRVGTRAVLSSLLYCAIECKLQGNWHRRSLFDCTTAGAITGAVFGIRGVPGYWKGSALGAAAFGTYAAACRLLFL